MAITHPAFLEPAYVRQAEDMAPLPEAEDSEDDEDMWDEVPIEHNIEITLDSVTTSNGKGGANGRQGKGGVRNRVSHEERLGRILCHKLHTICLTANAIARNRWLNDDLLQARLLSLTPLDVQISFSAITKARYPNAGERGHRFEKALTKLVEWWSGVFFQAEPEGHIRNRTYEAVTARMELPDYRGKLRQDFETGALVELLEDILDDEGEIIRAPKSLMKHALMQSGCRDTGAQLFTALCRALDLPTRLIASIQSVPWKVNVDKPKAPPKPKKKTESDADGPQSEASSHKPTIKLRKTPHKGHVLGKKSKVPPPKRTEDALYMPPVFWTEVYSRADGRWIPIDPLRAITNNRKVFDPIGVSTENRMIYVLAFEEDGYVRDITRKYAREFSSKAGKLRKGQAEWWDRVVGILTRPYRLARDDAEDDEMNSLLWREGMPMTIAGFKDHPLYTLARHLHKNQAIWPPDTPELGRFRGESVYPRSSVLTLKSADTWMRTEGRIVKSGEQAIKFVKQHSSTINRQREVEVLKEQGKVGDEGIMHGLYSRMQTELYVPAPIVDGHIPKNDFGNLDLYVPSMLPEGAVHVPYKGTAKIARRLGIEFAEAVTGFEFKKRRATPIVEGVVIAKENEQWLLDTFWEAEQDAQEKARLKRLDKAVKQWARLVHGLRIRKRLQDQYGTGDQPTEEVSATVDEQEPNGGGGFLAKGEGVAGDVRGAGDGFHGDGQGGFHEGSGGGAGSGFLVGAGDVVTTYKLPKAQFLQDEGPGPSTLPLHRQRAEEDVEVEQPVVFETMDLDEDEEEEEPEPVRTRAPTPIQHTDDVEELPDITARIPGQDRVTITLPETRTRQNKIVRPTTGRNHKGKGKAKAAPKKKKGAASTKKRKRGKKNDDEEEEEEAEDTPDEEGPSKRARVDPAPPPVQNGQDGGGRTLRPRRAKSEAQLKREALLRQAEEEDADL